MGHSLSVPTHGGNCSQKCLKIWESERKYLACLQQGDVISSKTFSPAFCTFPNILLFPYAFLPLFHLSLEIKSAFLFLLSEPWTAWTAGASRWTRICQSWELQMQGPFGCWFCKDIVTCSTAMIWTWHTKLSPTQGTKCCGLFLSKNDPMCISLDCKLKYLMIPKNPTSCSYFP